VYRICGAEPEQASTQRAETAYSVPDGAAASKAIIAGCASPLGLTLALGVGVIGGPAGDMDGSRWLSASAPVVTATAVTAAVAATAHRRLRRSRRARMVSNAGWRTSVASC
jgi:hypothetical protein